MKKKPELRPEPEKSDLKRKILVDFVCVFCMQYLIESISGYVIVWYCRNSCDSIGVRPPVLWFWFFFGMIRYGFWFLFGFKGGLWIWFLMMAIKPNKWHINRNKQIKIISIIKRKQNRYFFFDMINGCKIEWKTRDGWKIKQNAFSCLSFQFTNDKCS